MSLKWIGSEKGVEGLPGIPGRDLSDDEVKQFGGEEALLGTGLYERESGGKQPARRETKEAEDTWPA